ncbi:hypothetical protein AKJ52_00915 [candidate division MSBL1 archaeon SCGC-AAA382C18]|uniref:Uncharacterized protein n=1 Tax=candidate division MSBL1 archaeon SCGC-AAA382C18 TaxID=1698281 RepID=A0A133VKW9_9EURY|nr:hypothetical protein AKJ52_00915 [candidate division MSBL1 archaeon SCGC-AAA382C18]
MTADFSSMSGEEKRGYLIALGINPENLGEFASGNSSDPQKAKGERVSIKKDEFSKKEIHLLRKKTAMVEGSLSVAFYEMLRADFVDVEVGDQVTVEVRPHGENGVPEPLSVRETVEVGLEPYI